MRRTRRSTTSRICASAGPPVRRVARKMLGLLMLILGCLGCAEVAEEPTISSSVQTDSAAVSTARVVGNVRQNSGGPRSIIILRSLVDQEVPLPSESAQIDQYGRAFIPRLVVVREGQVVEFTNSEDELHNVHVVDESGISVINVGMPILGGTFEHVFDTAGDYAVSCNVHPEMAAQIVVTASPFSTIADRDGTFLFEEIPAGSYKVFLRRGLESYERGIEIVAPVTEVALDF